MSILNPSFKGGEVKKTAEEREVSAKGKPGNSLGRTE